MGQQQRLPAVKGGTKQKLEMIAENDREMGWRDPGQRKSLATRQILEVQNQTLRGGGSGRMIIKFDLHCMTSKLLLKDPSGQRDKEIDWFHIAFLPQLGDLGGGIAVAVCEGH